jgi:hypothetical protein
MKQLLPKKEPGHTLCIRAPESAEASARMQAYS